MGRKKWYILVVVVALAAFGMTWMNVQNARKSEKEQELIFELKQLRTGIRLYIVTHQEKPVNLGVILADKSKPLDKIKWTAEQNNNGEFIDPFGSPYEYNAEKAWVRSTTEAYSSW